MSISNKQDLLALNVLRNFVNGNREYKVVSYKSTFMNCQLQQFIEKETTA